MANKHILTPQEVAQMLDIEASRVRVWIQEEDLPAEGDGHGEVFVRVDELLHFLSKKLITEGYDPDRMNTYIDMMTRTREAVQL